MYAAMNSGTTFSAMGFQTAFAASASTAVPVMLGAALEQIDVEQAQVQAPRLVNLESSFSIPTKQIDARFVGGLSNPFAKHDVPIGDAAYKGETVTMPTTSSAEYMADPDAFSVQPMFDPTIGAEEMVDPMSEAEREGIYAISWMLVGGLIGGALLGGSGGGSVNVTGIEEQLMINNELLKEIGGKIDEGNRVANDIGDFMAIAGALSLGANPYVVLSQAMASSDARAYRIAFDSFIRADDDSNFNLLVQHVLNLGDKLGERSAAEILKFLRGYPSIGEKISETTRPLFADREGFEGMFAKKEWSSVILNMMGHKRTDWAEYQWRIGKLMEGASRGRALPAGILSEVAVGTKDPKSAGEIFSSLLRKDEMKSVATVKSQKPKQIVRDVREALAVSILDHEITNPGSVPSDVIEWAANHCRKIETCANLTVSLIRRKKYDHVWRVLKHGNNFADKTRNALAESITDHVPLKALPSDLLAWSAMNFTNYKDVIWGLKNLIRRRDWSHVKDVVQHFKDKEGRRSELGARIAIAILNYRGGNYDRPNPIPEEIIEMAKWYEVGIDAFFRSAWK